MRIQVPSNLSPNLRSPSVAQWLYFRASIRKGMAFSRRMGTPCSFFSCSCWSPLNLLFKESPCSPVVTFPNFGSEGHGVQLLQGDSVSFSLFVCFFLCVGFHFLFYTIFFFSVSTKLGVKRSFKKGHQTWVTVNCTHLAIFFFSFKSLFIRLQTLPNEF